MTNPNPANVPADIARVQADEKQTDADTATLAADEAATPPKPPTLSIVTSLLPGATVGTAYSEALTATGGTTPYAWSATGLPTGLSLNASSAVLSGTPTIAGTWSFTAQATDSGSPAQIAKQALSIAVAAAPPVSTVLLKGISPGYVGNLTRRFSLVEGVLGEDASLRRLIRTAERIAVDLPRGVLANQMALSVSAGAKGIRLGANWGQSTPARGTYSWTYSDPAIEAAIAAGLDVTFILDGADIPPWAAAPGSALFGIEFAEFCTAAVTRYAAMGVHKWELFNEPNLGSNFGGTASGTQYGNVVKVATPAIKAADPKAIVIAGAISPAGDSDGNAAPETFLSGFYAAGGGPFADVISIHAYCFPSAPMDPSTSGWNFFLNIPTWIFAVMAANGDAQKPVWITEISWLTVPTSGGISLALQGIYLSQVFAQLKVWTQIKALFWYMLQDGVTTDTEDFGLITGGGTDKPAFAVFKAA